MAEQFRTFVLHKKWIDCVIKLKNEEAGVLFINILSYVNKEPVGVMSGYLLELYNQIIEQIELEWSKKVKGTNRFHWNYKGGVTSENKAVRNSFRMNLWRKDVFLRDQHTCQSCGIKGGILNAHHIKKFSTHKHLRFELSNGLTLCKGCHINIHKKTING